MSRSFVRGGVILPVHATAEQQRPDPVVVDVAKAMTDALDPFHQLHPVAVGVASTMLRRWRWWRASTLTCYRLSVGRTVNIGRPWIEGAPADHQLLSLPYPHGPGLAHCDASGRHVHVLWLVPITEAEARHAGE